MKVRFLIAATLCVGAPSAFGTLVFTPTFTSNFVTDFGGNAIAAENSWIAAAAAYSADFSDNIHINITVDAVADTSILGESSTPLISISYSNLYNAVLADAKTANDLIATGVGGSLGGNGTPGSATDPVTGSHGWWVTRSQEKALGLIPSDGLNDGTTTFGAGFAYTFSGPIQPGTYDFQDVAAHEISEIMGRIGLSGTTFSGSPGYTLDDAFSFAGAGSRTLGNGANANFSINDGTTLLKLWNNAAANGGDSRDWASGTDDSFNAFSSSGVANPVTAVDIENMDVLGYDGSSVPEPGTLALMAGGLLALGFARRRAAR